MRELRPARFCFRLCLADHDCPIPRESSCMVSKRIWCSWICSSLSCGTLSSRCVGPIFKRPVVQCLAPPCVSPFCVTAYARSRARLSSDVGWSRCPLSPEDALHATLLTPGKGDQGSVTVSVLVAGRIHLSPADIHHLAWAGGGPRQVWHQQHCQEDADSRRLSCLACFDPVPSAPEAAHAIRLHNKPNKC